MRTSRALACGAAGLLVVLTACSGSPADPAIPAKYTQLTVSQAYSDYVQFLPQFQDLSAQPKNIAKLTSGPETWVISTSDGNDPGPDVSGLTNTRIFVPKLTRYPRWFVAAGNTSINEGVLFVLVQRAAGAPWRETAELYDLGDEAQILPDLSAAGFGNLVATKTVPDTGASLAMQPAQLPAAYAQYLNDRGHGTQSSLFKAGSYTSGLVSLERGATAGAPPDGWKYTDTQAVDGLPEYALGAPKGKDAVVIFFTLDTVTWTAQSAKAQMPSASYTGLAEPPLSMLQALGVKSVRAGLRVSIKAVDENLAIVGPPGSGDVTIAANSGRTYTLIRS
jgi:hypothetical protein